MLKNEVRERVKVVQERLRGCAAHTGIREMWRLAAGHGDFISLPIKLQHSGACSAPCTQATSPTLSYACDTRWNQQL
jgi:hypothetical protein